MLQLACTLLLIAGLQTPAADFSRAVALARSGHTAEALELFERFVERDPADVEARLWVGRLLLRSGRTADAETIFRAVLAEHPASIDGRIALARVLTFRGEWRDALAMLHEVELVAGDNADVFAALARAYRRGGDDRTALRYFERARALAPDDPDLAMGYEAVARTSGHWIALEGFHQGGTADATAGTFEANLRVMPRLHLQALVRVQQGDSYSDTSAGAGILWRLSPATTVSIRGRGGPDNIALVQREFSAEVVHYAGAVEIGGNANSLHYAGADTVAASVIGAWNPNDRWRFDGRYTYLHSSFDLTGRSAGNQSVMIRNAWHGGRRVALLGTYAYGIESLDDLTSDRLRTLGTSSLTGGVRIDVPSLTRLTVAWEHQWRTNSTTVNRVMIGVVQVIP